MSGADDRVAAAADPSPERGATPAAAPPAAPPSAAWTADVWRRYDDDEQRLTSAVSERMLDLAGLRPGQRVLDIASGRGEPAWRAARRVAPGGRVLGTDRSADILHMADERARAEGVRNLDTLVTSAETLEGVPLQSFDVVLSRWGLMYFDDPVQSLHRARACVIPGAVWVGALWADPARVSYHEWPRALLRARTGVPPPDTCADAPGVFRYADPVRLRRDLAAAGWQATHEEEMDTPVMEARTTDELAAWCLAFGLKRLLDGLPAAAREAWEQDVRVAGESLRRDGVMRLGGVTRLVVARAV